MKNYKITEDQAYIDEDEITRVSRVMVAKKLSMFYGSEVNTYEKALQKYFRVRHAMAVNSGSAAIHCALYGLKINKGDEVILPANALVLSVLPVLFVGAKPVFADIGKNGYGFDMDDLAKKIGKKTKAIMPVYLWGIAYQMDVLKEISNKYSIAILEDAAQAHGSRFDGKYLGTIGDVGCFSTFESKMICTGEGGFVLTDNDEIAHRVRSFRSHCVKFGVANGLPSSDYYDMGYNYRLNEISAAIGCEQVKKLNQRIKIRKKNYNIYRAELKNITTIDRFLKDSFDHNCFSYVFLDDEYNKKENSLAFKLHENGIVADNIKYNYRLSYKHTVLKKYRDTQCRNAEKYAHRYVNLPTHEYLTEKDLEYICQTVNRLL